MKPAGPKAAIHERIVLRFAGVRRLVALLEEERVSPLHSELTMGIALRGFSIALLAVLSTCTAWSAEQAAPGASGASAPAAIESATAAPAASVAPVQLGSPDYRPTPERPFGWRGDGSGQFPGATPPTEWLAKKNVRWATVVGSSYSSPILTDRFVIVTAEPNLVVCLNRADGTVQWKIKVQAADLPDAKSQKAAEKYKPPEAGAGLAAATPLTDGTTIYVLFANGILDALDLNGKSKWITLVDARRMAGYGRSSSPILYAGKLFVHMTDLHAFDPATGKELWVNTDAKSNYGTPTGTKIEGVDVIVTSAGDVVGVADGKTLDTAIGQCFHASPIAKENTIFFGEGAAAAVRVTLKNGKYKDKELWDIPMPGDVFSSPILHGGLLFTATGKGELFAFDASDKGLPDPVIAGRRLFDGDAIGGPPPDAAPGGAPGGDAPGGPTPIDYASLTLAGKYLFLNSNQGDTVVLDATREAKPVAKNTLPDGSGASPVFSGTDLYLRDGNKLFCISQHAH
jgi:outer membrane protein assembly factor BamB